MRYIKYDVYNGVRKIKTKTTLAISGTALGITGLLIAVAMPLAAKAAPGYTLFGDAAIVQPGNGSANAVQMASITNDGSSANDYGGVNYAVPAGISTLSDLNNLGSDYKVTSGDCGGGSPRFQVNVTTPSNTTVNLFVYIGPPPNYTGCPPNVWTNTGNLVTPASLVDASQLGGTFYEPYSAVLLAYGSYPVTGFQLVTDGGWAVGGNQTVLADNTQINTNTYTYEPAPTKDSCKNNGWKTMTDANGKSFKNQGDCVSYFATNGKNTAAGPSVVSTPTITSPTNNSVQTSAQLTNIDWTDSISANTPVTYEYRAYSDAAYSSLIYDSGQGLTSSNIPTPGTPAGVYYVQVQAKDSLGHLSAWSNDASNPYKITVSG